MKTQQRIRAFSKNLASWIEEKKGADILLLDVRHLTNVTDYFVIASGSSAPQIHALFSHIMERSKQEGFYPLHIEGEQVRRWILMDFGSVIVHLFMPQSRMFYQLEKLWDEAKRLRLRKKSVPDKERSKKSPRK